MEGQKRKEPLEDFRIPTLPAADIGNSEACQRLLEKYNFRDGEFVGLSVAYWKGKCMWLLKLTFKSEKCRKYSDNLGSVPLVDTRYEERLRFYMRNILPIHYSLGRIYVEYVNVMKSIVAWNVELIMKDNLLMVLGEPMIDEYALPKKKRSRNKKN